MSIERETIHQVAALAELAVTDQEAAALAGQLDRIVAFVAQLEQAEVPAGAGEFVAGPARVALREDVVAPEKLHRTPEMLTTGFRDGYYVVPKLASQEPGE
jgi:aspartyl-tRNA(Asn)/glutamyl-tRNA(Gln) amidotransferase subunit C